MSEELYKKALQLDDRFALAYQGLGNIYYKMKHYDKAEEYYQIVISINEKDPALSITYEQLGNIYYNNSKYDEALNFYKEAIKADPMECSNALNGIGNIYYQKDEFKQAISYYKQAIKKDSQNSAPYFNLGNIYFYNGNYKQAKKNYQKYLDLESEKDFFSDTAVSKIREISKIQLSEDYEKIQKIISKVQKCLEYQEDCITHFTGLSIAKELILKRSQFRLSEGTYLNDTSEGMTLFDYLKYESPLFKKESQIDEIFVQKPFIGSFVSQNKHNDLTMWRMYGKEGMEEARGCAITMNKEIFVEEIIRTHKIDRSTSTDKNFKFYRVAYQNESGKFFIPELSDKDAKVVELNVLCEELKKTLEEFKKKPESNDVQKDIEELLFEVVFLFKGIEYQYEHEVRLVQKGVGFEKYVDQDFKIPKVYINLTDISKSIKKITLGPKVERVDEWASALYYQLQNNEVEAEIHISRQPFK